MDAPQPGRGRADEVRAGRGDRLRGSRRAADEPAIKI
jgi:hypothetical protein